MRGHVRANVSGYVRGAVMNWVKPNWFLWGGFIFSTVIHVAYWVLKFREGQDDAYQMWFLSGAFICLFGYLAFGNLQA